MSFDLETLNKSLVYVKSADTPEIFYAILPELNPASSLPIDQLRLEPYVRLKGLPLDLRRLVASYAEAAALTQRIEQLIPGIPRAVPTHYPSGIVELQWKFDNTSVFAVALHGYKIALKEEGDELMAYRQGKITWRFHGPRMAPQAGEFKSLDELLDFMAKSIVTT